ncbi:hypothetical protein CRG98_021164 [Punica granatum]|uniref:Uncharacterized protein n=1 Tax=Punica granatum TaxID=22663 RepID=A0A2I0JSF9_PUNGR|nr:hypothetical protein CRG98_021164 [Punica granatum]
MTGSVPTSLVGVTHYGDHGANFNQGDPSLRRGTSVPSPFPVKVYGGRLERSSRKDVSPCITLCQHPILVHRLQRRTFDPKLGALFTTGKPEANMRAYRHPGTTRVGEQASDDLSELDLVSRGTFQWSQTPPGEPSGQLLSKKLSTSSPSPVLAQPIPRPKPAKITGKPPGIPVTTRPDLNQKYQTPYPTYFLPLKSISGLSFSIRSLLHHVLPARRIGSLGRHRVHTESSTRAISFHDFAESCHHVQRIRLLGVQQARFCIVPWPELACRLRSSRVAAAVPYRVTQPVAPSRVSRLSRLLPRLFSSHTEARNNVKDPPRLKPGQGIFGRSPLRGGRIIRDLFGVSVGPSVFPR